MAWARSDDEELAEKALTQPLSPGLSVARFTLAALVDHIGIDLGGRDSQVCVRNRARAIAGGGSF